MDIYEGGPSPASENPPPVQPPPVFQPWLWAAHSSGSAPPFQSQKCPYGPVSCPQLSHNLFNDCVTTQRMGKFTHNMSKFTQSLHI